MEQENKKKKGKIICCVFIVILLISGAFFVGWKIGLSNGNKSSSSKSVGTKSKKSKKTTVDENTADNVEQENISIENVDVANLTVKSGKVINTEASGYSYSEIDAGFTNMGLSVSVDKADNTGLIEIQWIKFNQYSTRFREKNAQGGTFGDNIQKITVNGFKGKVHAAYIGSFGQSSGKETAYFVMTDGSVEYVPIQKLYDVCGYLEDATVNSYGVLENVSGVAKVVTANYNAPQSTGAVTTVGIKADGSFYDFSFIQDVNGLSA